MLSFASIDVTDCQFASLAAGLKALDWATSVVDAPKKLR
jgi:hypothetical protein